MLIPIMGYIFTSIDQVIAHDLQTGEPLDWLPHEEPVYGLSVHPSQVNGTKILMEENLHFFSAA